jgi:nucleotide-binding universal stress UspA family protein
MYSKILVPVDGSPTSAKGLQEAIKLAKALGSRLRLVHVVDELIIDYSGLGATNYYSGSKALHTRGRGS